MLTILHLILMSSSALGKKKEIFILFCDFSSVFFVLGTLLYRINETNFFCPSEDVAFFCSSPDYLDWRFDTLNGYFITTTFDREYNRLGQVRQYFLDITTVSASVEFINSSHIGSIAFFTNAALLNGTLIRCNQEIISFTPIVASKSHLLMPVCHMMQVSNALINTSTFEFTDKIQ